MTVPVDFTASWPRPGTRRLVVEKGRTEGEVAAPTQPLSTSLLPTHAPSSLPYNVQPYGSLHQPSLRPILKRSPPILSQHVENGRRGASSADLVGSAAQTLPLVRLQHLGDGQRPALT